MVPILLVRITIWRRFVIFFNNGTNKSAIDSFYEEQNITWHFITPRSLHHGGLWKAGVKAVTHHLRRVTNDHLLLFEEFTTLTTHHVLKDVSTVDQSQACQMIHMICSRWLKHILLLEILIHQSKRLILSTKILIIYRGGIKLLICCNHFGIDGLSNIFNLYKNEQNGKTKSQTSQSAIKFSFILNEVHQPNGYLVVLLTHIKDKTVLLESYPQKQNQEQLSGRYQNYVHFQSNERCEWKFCWSFKESQHVTIEMKTFNFFSLLIFFYIKLF